MSLEAPGPKFSHGSQLLKDALAARGWSQKRLNRELGGNANSSYWIKGQRRPGLEVALKLSRLLDIPVDAWLQEPSAPEVAA